MPNLLTPLAAVCARRHLIGTGRHLPTGHQSSILFPSEMCAHQALLNLTSSNLLFLLLALLQIADTPNWGSLAAWLARRGQ